MTLQSHPHIYETIGKTYTTRRPEMYLLEDVQASISSLAQLPRDVVLSAMDRLRADLKSGVWRSRNSELLEQESYDFGYCLIVAEQEASA